MCLGCSKEPSHGDGSFEYPQHMFWLRNKKNNFQLRTLIWGAWSGRSWSVGCKSQHTRLNTVLLCTWFSNMTDWITSKNYDSISCDILSEIVWRHLLGLHAALCSLQHSKMSWHITVKLNFRLYIQWYTSPNEYFEYSYPLIKFRACSTLFLLITFANSLDPDQDRHFVGPVLDPNRLTLW